LIVVSTITLSLQDLTVGTSYFTGSAWQNGSTSFPAQGTVSNWNFNSSALSLVNDHQYQLTASALDNSGKTGSATFSFVYDVQKPTSTVASPVPGYFTAAPLATISGKANDQVGNPANPSGLASNAVSIAVESLAGAGAWWNGATFSGANPVYSTATFTGISSGTWSYNVPVALQNAFTSGTSYYFVSRSTDNAANTEFGITAGAIPAGVGVTITYDTAPPTAVFTVPNYAALPAAKAFDQLPTLTGTASGDTGVSSVQVAILKIGSPSLWFDGTNFTKNQAAPYFLNVTGATAWSYAGSANLASALADHAQYVFVTSAAAPSGLIQSVFTVGSSSFTLIYDHTSPSASITVPAAATPAFRRAAIGQSASLFSGNSSDSGLFASGVKDVGLRL
jgi:hypothetical protein